MYIKHCKYCCGIGYVFMREVEFPHSSSSLACTCHEGSKVASIVRQKGDCKYREVQWNGQQTQVVKGRMLKFDTPSRLEEIIYKKYERNPVRQVVSNRPTPNWVDTDN